MGALEGEVVGRELDRRVGPEPQADLYHLHYKIHVVDLPSGGRIDGMGREDALRLARRLGTRAYEAQATLVIASGLVVVEPIVSIHG